MLPETTTTETVSALAALLAVPATQGIKSAVKLWFDKNLSGKAAWTTAIAVFLVIAFGDAILKTGWQQQGTELIVNALAIFGVHDYISNFGKK